ncbi:MAG: hypothetical protein EGR18_04620, partial [Bifidobacterium breve]|nr:hypothetical protein [Bifidobacterium breve]
RALRSHRRGRGFDYRQLHETLCIHSTAEGLFILKVDLKNAKRRENSLVKGHSALRGADLVFAGGLPPFQGAGR